MFIEIILTTALSLLPADNHPAQFEARRGSSRTFRPAIGRRTYQSPRPTTPTKPINQNQKTPETNNKTATQSSAMQAASPASSSWTSWLIPLGLGWLIGQQISATPAMAMPEEKKECLPSESCPEQLETTK